MSGPLFDGTSPYAELAAEHLTSMIGTHAEMVSAALYADPGFDPLAHHDEV